MDDGRFRSLHALRVKGLTSAAVAAEIVSMPQADVESHLARLEEEGLVRHRTGGRVEGYSLTKDGKAAHAELLADDVDGDARSALEAAYERFLPVNGEFKKVCSAWQVRGEDGDPNDHSDEAYDAEVIDDLAAVHSNVATVLDALGSGVDRTAGYLPRLAAALERVRGGERRAFTAPMTESYHDIWMELHQDLIVSLGRTRDAADER